MIDFGEFINIIVNLESDEKNDKEGLFVYISIIWSQLIFYFVLLVKFVKKQFIYYFIFGVRHSLETPVASHFWIA